MTRVLKFFLSALLALALLFTAAAGALAWWLAGDGPRTRVQALASEKLGVQVTLSKLSLDVFPWPSVALSDLKIATQAPLTAERIELRPAWRKLVGWSGAPRELEMASLSLRGVNLPQQGLDQMAQTLSKKEQTNEQGRVIKPRKALKSDASEGMALTQLSKVTPSAQSQANEATPAILIGALAVPQHTRLEAVMWTSKAGESLSLSGDLSLNDARDALTVDLQLAGGSLRGPLRLASKNAQTDWQLSGELAMSNIDLAQLPGAGLRMAGRLAGTTTLNASAAQLSGIGAALQTNTAFNVSDAVIKGIDLAKAVRTLGLSRGGETALQQLSGNLATRGTGAPMLLTLSDLQAKSSILQAKGAVSIGAAAKAGAPRALNGRLDVDLTAGSSNLGQAVDKTVGQLVGIPLEISGTTAAPVVAPTPGAMIGGAIGSVMAPVIGTGAGAKIGDKAAQKLESWKEKLFGK